MTGTDDLLCPTSKGFPNRHYSKIGNSPARLCLKSPSVGFLLKPQAGPKSSTGETLKVKSSSSPVVYSMKSYQNMTSESLPGSGIRLRLHPLRLAFE